MTSCCGGANFSSYRVVETVYVASPSGVAAAVVVAVVIFSIRPRAAGHPRLQVLLVQRGVEPFPGYWSLPDGRLRGPEALDEAAWRQLLEKT